MAAKTFLERLLEYLTDQAVCDMLLRRWLDPLMDDCIQNANANLDELIAVRRKDPVTTNHYFRDNVSKTRLERGRMLKELIKNNSGPTHHCPYSTDCCNSLS